MGYRLYYYQWMGRWGLEVRCWLSHPPPDRLVPSLFFRFLSDTLYQIPVAVSLRRGCCFLYNFFLSLTMFGYKNSYTSDYLSIRKFLSFASLRIRNFHSRRLWRLVENSDLKLKTISASIATLRQRGFPAFLTFETFTYNLVL